MTDNPHIRRAYAAAAGRDPGQTVFLQALETLYDSLVPLLEEQPLYPLAERLAEPERTAVFPVCWTDGQGRARQARGFFIRHSAILGPARETVAFRRGLDLAAAKALALETALESSLAGLHAGGGFVGADADVRAMDSGESLRFCRGFMDGLYPLLPRDFRPERWAGLAPRRELGYLTGRFEQLRGEPCREGCAPTLTRAQAVGWGLCRFVQSALHALAGVRLEGQTVLLAGRAAAAAWAGEMAVRLGAQVTAAGDGSGYLYAAGGLPLSILQRMAAQPELPLLLWAIRAPGVEYRPGPGLWEAGADLALLFGDGARLDAAGARQLLAGEPLGVFEGAACACTASAGRILAGSGALYAPAVAAGCGGAILARLPAAGTRWETERRLRGAMDAVLQTVLDEAAADGRPGDLRAGAYAAAFRRIAGAAARKGLL